MFISSKSVLGSGFQPFFEQPSGPTSIWPVLEALFPLRRVFHACEAEKATATGLLCMCVCVEPSCQTAKYQSHRLDEICSLRPSDSLDLCPAQLVHWTTLGGPQAHVGNNWPPCALSLLLSGPRLSIGTRPESALTW